MSAALSSKRLARSRWVGLLGTLLVLAAMLSACTSQQTTGVLSINLKSRSRLTGKVVVTGPGGFRATTTTSEALRSLHPGTYILTASPVSAPGGQWWPSNPTLAAEVQAGRTTMVSDAYTVEVPSTTKVLSAIDLEPQPTLAPSASGAVLLPASIATNLAAGDILVAPVGPLDPEGLLRRVVAVNVSGTAATVETGPATIVQAVPTGSFDLQFGTSHPIAGQTSAIYVGGHQIPLQLASSSSPPQLQISLTNPDLIPCGLYGNASSLSGPVSQQLLTNLHVTPAPHLIVDWVKGVGLQATYTVSLTDQYTFGVKAGLGVRCNKQISVPSALVPISPVFDAFVGPIPLAIQAEDDFLVQLKGDMTHGAAFGFRQAATLTLGLSASSKGATPISSFRTSFTTPNPAAEDLNVTAAAGPQLVLTIEGLTGPYLSLQLFGTATASTSPAPQGSRVVSTLAAGIRAGAGINLSVFGFVNLNVGIPNILQYSKQIYDKTTFAKSTPTTTLLPTTTSLPPSPPSTSAPPSSVPPTSAPPSSLPPTTSTPPSVPPTTTPGPGPQSGGAATPQDAVNGYIQAVLSDNFGLACSYALPDQQSACSTAFALVGLSASGTAYVGSTSVSGADALVVMEGNLCLQVNGASTCGSNTNPTFGLPSSGQTFADVYNQVIAYNNASNGTTPPSSPYFWLAPVTEIGGNWYVNLS